MIKILFDNSICSYVGHSKRPGAGKRVAQPNQVTLFLELFHSEINLKRATSEQRVSGETKLNITKKKAKGVYTLKFLYVY